jgi:predicted nucleic acid-binding protein
MELAATGLYRAKWTSRIHEEWTRNVLENRPDITKEQLERTVRLMNKAAPDANVENSEPLETALSLPDKNDCHVLAAAIHCKAAGIVTFNLRHFPESALSLYEIIAQHPDEFLYHQIGLDQASVLNAVRRIRERLKSPPKTAAAYLATLEAQGLPATTDWLRDYETIL